MLRDELPMLLRSFLVRRFTDNCVKKYGWVFDEYLTIEYMKKEFKEGVRLHYKEHNLIVFGDYDDYDVKEVEYSLDGSDKIRSCFYDLYVVCRSISLGRHKAQIGI